MLETGQPLHFYDLAKIPAKEITVKNGLNEIYTALDGQKYHVLEDDLMITTENRAIGYAGIMGGEDSKIDENTRALLLRPHILIWSMLETLPEDLVYSQKQRPGFLKG